jgi:hypothetical protein
MTDQALPVSVVIPVHDRADLLAQAIEGVHRQTVTPAEIVVVDDFSNDDSAAVAERLGCRVVRHSHNQGAAAARNTGVAAARQDWIALLDSDDVWRPDHLHTAWRARDGHTLVSTSALVVTVDGRPSRVIGPPLHRSRTLTAPGDLLCPENIVVASGSLVRREAIQAVGGYDTSLRYAEDFDLWTRLLVHGTGIALPQVTVIMATHDGRKSSHASGPSAAQRTIVARVEAESGDHVRAQRRLGVRAWDDMRRGLSDGDRALARTACTALLANPQRIIGVVGIWVWRRQMHRRARAFGSQGRPRVAVTSWPADRPLPGYEGEIVEDLRAQPFLRRIATLVRSPPHAVIVRGRWGRRWAAVVGSAAREPRGPGTQG